METISVMQPINLKVVRFELDFTPCFEEESPRKKEIKVPDIKYNKKRPIVPTPPPIKNHNSEVRLN